MTTNLTKSRTLNNSGEFLRTSQSSRSNNQTLSDAKEFLKSDTLENIEIEYIKNLQQQIQFLELECNYLRQKMERSGLKASLKYGEKSENLKLLESKLEKTSSALRQSVKVENDKLIKAKKTFDIERELLLEEISLLKREKIELEDRYRNSTVDLNTLDKHHQEIRQIKQQLSVSESQSEQLRKDNVRLRVEITEARETLNNRDQLIKELQTSLNETKHQKHDVHHLKSSLNDMTVKHNQTIDRLNSEIEKNEILDNDKQRLLKEIGELRTELSDYKLENQRLNSRLEESLKQNEMDLIIAQKNTSMIKTNAEQLESEINELRDINRNLEAQIEQFKLQERNDLKNQSSLKTRIRELEESLQKANLHEIELRSVKDDLLSKQRQFETERSKFLHEIESLKLFSGDLEKRNRELTRQLDDVIRNRENQLDLVRNKTDVLQSNLDDQLEQLKLEKANNKQLKLQIQSLTLQDQTNAKHISGLKAKINDLENELHQYELKQNESTILQKELNEVNVIVMNRDEEIRHLRATVDRLNSELKEMERLKQIGNLVQSQQWEEFGTLAENMKHLSRSYGQSTTSTIPQTTVRIQEYIEETN